MKWLEKRIKAKRDEEAEQQQRMLSSESEKEEGEKRMVIIPKICITKRVSLNMNI
jgi:hypothetical protein